MKKGNFCQEFYLIKLFTTIKNSRLYRARSWYSAGDIIAKYN